MSARGLEGRGPRSGRSKTAIVKYATIESRSWITVASGPDPNAGSRPSRASRYGRDIATAVASDVLTRSESDTTAATRVSSQTASANRKKLAAIRLPMMTPVRSSRTATLPIGMPSDIPRMTTVSVCVPTASAM